MPSQKLDHDFAADPAGRIPVHAIKTKLLSSAALMLGIALSASGNIAFAANAADQADKGQVTAISASNAGVEEITVTARHRVEKLQDVPIAVTALSAKQLEASGNFTVRQLQQQVPSLTILGFNPRNITIQIRGLGTTSGSVNSGIEPGVGVYVNGVFNARPSIVVFDLVDVESVNVLRGPQGTLFGKNTVAGVIDIKTNQASYTPEFGAEFTYGNYNFSQEKIYASAPIGDSGFAVRLAGVKSDRDGTIYNTTFQQGWQDYHNRAIRGEVAYKNPDESFKARLIGDYSDQKQYSGFSIIRGILPQFRTDGSVGWGGGRSFFDRSASAGYVPLPIDPSARQTDLNTPFTVNMQTGGASLQLDKTVLGGHTLTSITANRFWDWDPSLDGDNTGASVLTRANLPTKQRQWSEELRLASPSGQRLEYTLGLYYFWQKTTEVPYNSYGPDAAAYLYNGIAPAVRDAAGVVVFPAAPLSAAALNGLTQTGLQLAHTKSYSGFGNATWHATPELALTAGLRYTYEKRDGYYNAARTGVDIASFAPAVQTLIKGLVPTGAEFPAGSIPYFTTTSGGRVSGTVNATYKITQDIDVYGGYSRGFKSAGINLAIPVKFGASTAPQTFGPETIDAFEIGVKSTWFDKKLRVNADLFRSTDKGYQANNLIQDPLLPGTFRNFIANAGTVRTQGVEIDWQAKPVSGLTLSGGFSYDDAYFTSYKQGVCPYLDAKLTGLTSLNNVCDLTGNRVAGVPEFVWNIAAEYEHPLGQLWKSESLGYIGGDYSHRGSAFGALNDDPYSLIPAYGLLNLYAGIRDAAGVWDLKFWGKNVLNKTYFVNASVDSGTSYVYTGTLGDPRFYGVTLRLKY